MAGKKLSEMTAWERVLPRLKGLTNEEAEDIAIKILAQVMAKHTFIIKDAEEYLEAFHEKLLHATMDYVEKNSFMLGLGAVVQSMRTKGQVIVERAITSEQLDQCEEAAIKRASEVAYTASEGVNPNVQYQMYDTMHTFISTGIRLMREEVENIIE